MTGQDVLFTMTDSELIAACRNAPEEVIDLMMRELHRRYADAARVWSKVEEDGK
jgi:hypothetical protein